MYKKFYLTPRETEVKELILQGLSNKEIANKLIVSIHTAKSHVSSIISKLAVKNRIGIFMQEIKNLKTTSNNKY